MTMQTERILTGERADLLDLLTKQRNFLRYTVRDLTDDQARQHPTVSALCLAGVIKHVSAVERDWVDFIVAGPAGMAMSPERMATWASEFQFEADETLAGVLAEYAEVARQTDDLLRDLPDLDASQPLPEAPWFEPGARWSARQAILHIIAETAQHAGHADIIRESLDGARTMG